MNKWLRLFFAILFCQGAGVVGSFFTVSAIDGWYKFLIKPVFSPPNWIFGPVWLTLYTLMGLALFIVWQKRLDSKNVRFAFWFFIIHLVFNALWSVVFFGFQDIRFAFVVILILWMMIAVLMLKFYKINRVSAYLLMPYFLWVSFATILNYSIWQLNG